jgi:recombination protein RecT
MNQIAKQDSKKELDAMQIMQRNVAEIQKALPKTFNLERFTRIVITEFKKTPSLRECDPYSVLGAIMQSAQLGLEVGSGLGHAYLVPYKRECKLILGYKGIVDLTRRSGQVSSIYADAVYKQDHFKHGVVNNKAIVEHLPSLGMKRDDDIIAFYAIGSFVNGGDPQVCVMSIDEIIYIRDHVANGADKKTSPWNIWFAEMGKKTVVRRLGKMLPQSPEYVKAIQIGEIKPHQAMVEIGLIADDYATTEKADITEIAKSAAAEPEYKVPGQRDPDKEKALMDFDSILAQYDSKKINPDAALSTLNIKVADVAKMDAGRIRSVTKILMEKYK